METTDKKTDLIRTASKLKQPAAEATIEFEGCRESLSSEMNRLMASRSDINQLIGIENIQMMEDNHRNHLRFMAAIFLDYQPEVLVETVLWVFRAYRSHGFQLTYWPAQLDQWVELFRNHLSDTTFKEIYPFYNWMIINQPLFVLESDRLILSSGSPSHGE